MTVTLTMGYLFGINMVSLIDHSRWSGDVW